MSVVVPESIIGSLDGILNKLAESRKIRGYKFKIGREEGAGSPEFDDSSWNDAEESVKYSRHQGITWFRFDVAVPEKVLDIDVKSSGIRLTSFFLAPTDTYVNGELRFSERTWMDFKNPEIVLTENAAPGEIFKVAVKLDLGEFCYYDGNFSMNVAVDRVEDAEFEISSFKEELKYACRFREVEKILPEVFKLIDESFENNEGVSGLVEKIKLSREMLKPMQGKAKENTVHLIGHAHIDMNWFWSIEETLDLVKRDFGTMTGIMEEAPDFKFSQSQCATYEMAEKHYPEIFEKMKKFIKSGNWDVTASAWVEGDVNMASGEAIARHILYSKRYLKEKFGFEPRILWDPDTFGHSANLPQIAKKGGIVYYFFMRCVRESPVFWWEGLDGSRLLACSMIYNSDMNAASALDRAKELEDSYGLRNSMYVYGTGDHGGGPTRRDIKRARQLNSYPTVPKLVFSTTHAFYDSVVNEKAPGIPVEKGELNYVFDGCYTTHADIKRYNRQCENALVSTEAVNTMAALNGLDYGREEIEKAWKAALFNQFHDIFDGSGVKATYTYAAKIAKEALETLEPIAAKSMAHIASKIAAADKGLPLAVFNLTGWNRSECIRVRKPDMDTSVHAVVDGQGKSLEVQTGPDYISIFVDQVPPMGYKTVYLSKAEDGVEYNPIKENEKFYEVETRYYTMEIKKDSGEITTLYDKKCGKYIVKREQIGWRLKKGILNTLKIHYEAPTPMSSWTIGPDSRVLSLISGAKTAIKEDGPVVKVIRFVHSFDNSTISQDMVIYNDSPRIDFVTHVDWNEIGDTEKEAPMLKAHFTPDIDNTCATYEIPYGAIERPCKDMEVPALKWMDISDGCYGMSLLNDCKYGHKARGNEMELTLIRSGWEPDPESDTGSHDFTYSILPHKGSWKEAEVIKEGYCLNNSLAAVFARSGEEAVLPDVSSYVAVDQANVAISAFKPAEDGDALILRLYEGAGDNVHVNVKMGFGIDRVEEVDINESKVFGRMSSIRNGFETDMGRFEIKTFKIYR